MKLKSVYENQEDIPEGYADLFTEKSGKWIFTGVEGIKTQADVDTLSTALAKERKDHKATKDKLATFGDLDPEEVHTKLDRIAELEAAAGGKIDEAKINEIVEGRVKTKLAPIERELKKAKDELAEREAKITEFTQKERNRMISDVVTKAARESKVRPEAIEDALMLAERVMDIDEAGNVVTKDGVGVTPGIDPATWLTEIQDKRAHWWPESSGAGALGNKGNLNGGTNPFTAEHWNMTEQGRIFKENRARAEQLAKSAGTTIGGQKPAAKK